jgi:isocitrate/isopropylmalate dehydrogenase
MSKQILILPGDGIGPEIMAEAVKVLELANDKYSLGFELSHDVIGGAAIDKHGVPLADETLDAPAQPTPCCWAPWAARNGTRSSVTSALSAAC